MTQHSCEQFLSTFFPLKSSLKLSKSVSAELKEAIMELFNVMNVKEVKVSPMSNQVNNKCLKSSRVYGHHQGVGSILRSSYNLNHMESKSSMKPDDCGRAYQHQHGQLQQLLRRPIKSSKKPGHSRQQELLGGPIKLGDTQQQLGRPIEKVCQERHKRYL